MLKKVSLHPVEDWHYIVHHPPYQPQPTEYAHHKDMYACMVRITRYSCKYATESHSSHVNIHSLHI